MTNDILRTDIELATRLVAEQRSAEAVIAALVSRGINQARAAQLVEDLRAGKKVDAQSTLPMEFGLARRSRSKSGSHGSGQDQPSGSSKGESRHEPRRHGADHGNKKAGSSWLVPAILVAGVVVVGGLLAFQHYRAGTGFLEDRSTNAPVLKVNGTSTPAPVKMPAPGKNPK